MLHKAVQLLHTDRQEGDLLMDAPDYSWDELKMMAANRDAWRYLLVNSIRGPRLDIAMTVSSGVAHKTRPFHRKQTGTSARNN